MFSTKSPVHFVSFFLLLALLLAPVSPARAVGIRYAAPNGVTSGNCDSWANACTLQTALASAANGDEIWVKMGVHYPGAAGNRSATFTLKNGVTIYGGFAGTESSRDDRDWTINKTILSGDIDQNDTNTDGNYIAETWNDIQGSNAYHVVTGNGLDNTTVLDGFVITAGTANGSDPNYSGGGMYNYSSNPMLRNLIFSGNSAAVFGGGMYNEDYNSLTLTNVTFSGNLAQVGGGMVNVTSSPMLTNVTFSGNSAQVGGGMFNWGGSSPTLNNVTFHDNAAANDGGGMYNMRFSKPTLNNVTFSGNSATNYGGGMYNEYYSDPTLINVTFNGNAAANGGGIFDSESYPTLINVTFSGNSATNYGGGMYNGYYSDPTLINVTFSGNSATNYGGGMYNRYYSDPKLTNAILWGDSAPNGPEIYNNSSTPTVSYSDIQGCVVSGVWQSSCGTNSGGNIVADPLFVNAAGGNLRLQLTSPAIDAGNNAAVPSGVTTDLDGKSRFCDIPTVPNKGNGTSPIVDMGAYEATTVFLPLVLR